MCSVGLRKGRSVGQCVQCGANKGRERGAMCVVWGLGKEGAWGNVCSVGLINGPDQITLWYNIVSEGFNIVGDGVGEP